MRNPETLTEFYKRQYKNVQIDLLGEVGHFNLFPLRPISKDEKVKLPYRRRDYYKVHLQNIHQFHSA